MITSESGSGQRWGARLGSTLRRLATGFAALGGVVLCSMVMLVVTSVIGRAVIAMPVPGDFEIVAIGTGVSIFLFLPYCYVVRGNVTVDILADHLPASGKYALDIMASVLFALIAGTFAWRMALGLFDTFSYGDITMIVGLPLWWAYPFAVASFGLVSVSAAYTAVFGWAGFDDEL